MWEGAAGWVADTLPPLVRREKRAVLADQLGCLIQESALSVARCAGEYNLFYGHRFTNAAKCAAGEATRLRRRGGLSLIPQTGFKARRHGAGRLGAERLGGLGWRWDATAVAVALRLGMGAAIAAGDAALGGVVRGDCGGLALPSLLAPWNLSYFASAAMTGFNC
jgi:hypothetical protein